MIDWIAKELPDMGVLFEGTRLGLLQRDTKGQPPILGVPPFGDKPAMLPMPSGKTGKNVSHDNQGSHCEALE